MAKQKKKRNKSYAGSSSANSRPTITRFSAVNRNRLQQWWFDHKTTAKPIFITIGIVLAIIVIIYEIIRLSSGSF